MSASGSATVSIVPIYAALLALLFIALSVRVIRLRRRMRIAISDGGNPLMARAMRVQANFAEYVPLSLLLIAFVEMSNAPPWFVHLLGAGLLIGRLAHAYGVSQTKEPFQFRVSGMVMTFTVMAIAAFHLLLHRLPFSV